MDEKDRQDRETLFDRHRENVYFRWGLTAFVVVAACIVVAQFVTKLPSVFGAARALLRTLAPVFYGLGIAYLLDPIVSRVQIYLQPRLESRMKTSAESAARGLGILAAVLLLILVIWALLAMVLPQLLDSIYTIVRNLPAYYNTARGWADELLSSNLNAADATGEIMDTVYGYLNGWLSDTLLPQLQSIVATLTSSMVGVAKTLFNLIIGLIISIYLLMGKWRFLAQAKKLCYALLGAKRSGYVYNVCTYANRAFGGFIGGKIIDSAIIGVLCFLGLSVMRMPYALLISIIVGVTNVIPFFGPYLGAVPSALLLLVISPVKALTFVIFILILQQVDGNVIGPMILGDATGLSGIWVLISILVFGSFWGLVGMILAVPTFAVIYKIVSEVTNRLLARRGLSTVTADYEKWNYPPRPEAEHWRPKPHRQSRGLSQRILRRLRTRSSDGDQSGPTEDGAQNASDSEES